MIINRCRILTILNQWRIWFLPVVLVISSPVAVPASGSDSSVLLPNGEPDPGYKRNAMRVWLRADSGVTNENGGVFKWHDRSIHGNDAVQTDAASQPVHAKKSFGGRDVVKFEGVGDHLKFSTGFDNVFDGSFTIFALIAPKDGDPDRDDVWFGLVGENEESRIVLATDGNEDSFAALYRAGGSSVDTKIVPNPFSDGPQLKFTVVSWVVSTNGNHRIYIDGNPQVAAITKGDVDNSRFYSGKVPAYLGAAQSKDGGFFPSPETTFAGRISEFLIYDFALSNVDREAVEDYLLEFKKTVAEAIPITSAVQLFLDDYLIESTEGLKREVQNWKKHPRNPVLRPDRPWEFGGNYINTYGSVIFDDQEKIFKVWYWTLNDEDSVVPTGQIKAMCYGTSEDGIHWRKPNLGLFEFQGSKNNNIVMASTREKINSLPTLFTFGAIKTPWDPDPAQLYKACFYERPPGANYIGPNDGAWTAISPDGIHWTKSNSPAVRQLGDTVGFCYDSIHHRYLCFGKRYTDRGRSRFQSESRDFSTWTEPRLILKTDDQDDQPCEFYNNTGFVWGEMLLGWLQVFYMHQDPFKHRLVLELIYSRDGLVWHRMPSRKPVLDVGPDGSWDRTNQSAATGPPIVVGDKMYLYYGGHTRYHGPYKGANLGEARGQIGLGMLRRDGFVSMNATPSGGILITKPLQVKTDPVKTGVVELHLNVKSNYGHCRVEFLDELGRPIDGYTKADCNDVVSDKVDIVTMWKGQSDVSKLVRRPFRLRFYLQNARLYSFRLLAGNAVE